MSLAVGATHGIEMMKIPNPERVEYLGINHILQKQPFRRHAPTYWQLFLGIHASTFIYFSHFYENQGGGKPRQYNIFIVSISYRTSAHSTLSNHQMIYK
jgi:hypothetical protein